jgi:hypothetical protein
VTACRGIVERSSVVPTVAFVAASCPGISWSDSEPGRGEAGRPDLSFGILKEHVGHAIASVVAGDVDLFNLVGDHHDKAGDLASDHSDRGVIDAF